MVVLERFYHVGSKLHVTGCFPLKIGHFKPRHTPLTHLHGAFSEMTEDNLEFQIGRGNSDCFILFLDIKSL